MATTNKKQPTELQKVLEENKHRFIVSDNDLKAATAKAELRYYLLPRTQVCVREKEFHYCRAFHLLLEKVQELVKSGYVVDTKSSNVNGTGFLLIATKPPKMVKQDLDNLAKEVKKDLLDAKEADKQAFIAELVAEQEAQLLIDAQLEAAAKAAKLASDISALISK